MKKVIIYSTPACVYCKIAKDWLNEHSVPFTEYDVAEDAEKREEMMEKTGQMAVPVIDIEGEIVIGFDKAKLSALLGV